MATILVVDDDPSTVHLINAWLTRYGYQVITASSGEEAIRAANTGQPDLVLLDVMMPDLSGTDVCRQLRENSATARLPVILMTAYDPSVGRAEALVAGATDYITKPIIFSTLAERIRLLLARERGLADSGSRLLDETVHAALSIVPCHLAWLLVLDARQSLLVHSALATSRGLDAGVQFLNTVKGLSEQAAFPLALDGSLLARIAMTGAAGLNISVSGLREAGEQALYIGCSALDLYFISILPLHMAGTPLGVLLLGTRDLLNVETSRGQQLMGAVTGQAATAVYSSQLIQALAEREAQTAQERTFRQVLLDVMSDGLLACDYSGRIGFANRRLALMMGCEPADLEGMQVDRLFVPPDRSRIAALLDRSPSAGTSALDTDLMRSSEQTLPVRVVQASAPPDQAGDLPRVMVIKDLSEQKAREQALARQSNRLNALYQATQAITSTLSLREIIRTILSEAGKVFDASIAAILLNSPDGQELVFHAAIGPLADRVRGCRLPLGQGVAGYVARTGQPALTPDAMQDARFGPTIPPDTGVETRAAAAAPLTVDGRTIGVIEVIHTGPDVFDRADLETLTGLAHSAAIAIGNARLYGEAQRHVRDLTMLLRTSETASSMLAIEQVLGTVTRQLIEELSVDWCLVSAWDAAPRTLTHLSEMIDIVWPDGQGPAVRLADYPALSPLLTDGELVVIDTGETGQPASCLDGTSLPGVAAVLLLPLEVAGQIVGLAELCRLPDGREFSAEDQQHARTAAQFWGRGVTAAEAWTDPEALRQLVARLRHTVDATRCTLYARQPDRATLAAVCQVGEIIWPMGQGPSRQLADDDPHRMALAERTAVVAPTPASGTLRLEPAAFYPLERGAHLICPLMARGEAIGLVELVDPDSGRVFSPADLSLAQGICNLLGSALENARLYTTLLRRAAQLEAAYNDLKEADRLKAEWIQNVSHELRTPLTSLIGYIDLMLEEDLGPLSDDQRDGLGIMKAKSRQLASLVEDILMVQLVEHDPLACIPLSLADLAQAAADVARPRAERANLTIAVETAPGLFEVSADSNRLLQVFGNLLDNAIKFSPDGGQITISVDNAGPNVRVRITDPGIGIPAEEHEKIWRRFYQVDGGLTRAYGGTGLGLTIVRQVIEQHNGYVWVESEPGKGSTFSFALPGLIPPDVPGPDEKDDR